MSKSNLRKNEGHVCPPPPSSPTILPSPLPPPTFPMNRCISTGRMPGRSLRWTTSELCPIGCWTATVTPSQLLTNNRLLTFCPTDFNGLITIFHLWLHYWLFFVFDLCSLFKSQISIFCVYHSEFCKCWSDIPQKKPTQIDILFSKSTKKEHTHIETIEYEKHHFNNLYSIWFAPCTAPPRFFYHKVH